ncbi:hypothetical protein [Halorubrum sp. SP9]|nr:hypothetical protein [Halorubrum sp. SP9]
MSDAVDRGGADPESDADVSSGDRRAGEPTMTTRQHTTPRQRYRTRTNR